MSDDADFSCTLSIVYNMLMDKEILQHQAFVEEELTRLTQTGLLGCRYGVEHLYALRSYNRDEIRNFQHERQIHLIVTVTFAFIMIGSWALLFNWLVADGGRYDTVTWLVIAIAALLTTLEAFYIRFYYHLENWTQRLYRLDRQIYQAIQDMLK